MKLAGQARRLEVAIGSVGGGRGLQALNPQDRSPYLINVGLATSDDAASFKEPIVESSGYALAAATKMIASLALMVIV